MASAGISSYRDRTSEFLSLSESLARTESRPGPSTVDPLRSKPDSSSSASARRSEFNKKASRVGLGIHETSQKIARLTKLAKSSSMFNDPTLEIQELTALIKSDIDALSLAVSELQALQNFEVSDRDLSKDSIVHSTTICDDLKSRLMGTTKQFKDVLTARTENLKAHESRRQIFSANTSQENRVTQHSSIVAEPPPWSSSLGPSTLSSGGVSNGSQLRRRLGSDVAPSHSMEVQMLQQTVPRQDNYMQSREVALQNVESTISELGSIFTQLATMVAQQGELAIRIDDNMEETLSNVEGARSALLRHLNRVSSNRWLMIKIFAVLIFFMLLFVFFVL
ncbi:Syntaxin [Nymphaea thermarum]|nr:Syntaxin [Nymphaea thermarum]